ncbi:hypothetical protein [Roseivivax sp. THAF30]|uniref:hypothetical protein n=1 Tax=Roseivivax sp. THAF30 TaxID=2587852 RepID=UPI001267963C|nr:hypothetical protein [Roseivivax sp. THAF30]QFT62873.1 hypothetical protein FIU91_08070 [Roseivivax sp. THAF30]
MTIAFTLATTGHVVDDLIALNAQALPGMSRRDHAAWIMNVLAHAVAPVLTRWDAQGLSLSDVPAETFHLTTGTDARDGLTFAPICEAPANRPRSSAPAASFAAARLFAPSVNALAFAGPIAPRALWRIAGDGLAFGWILQGERLRAEDVLKSYGAPFSNRQLQLEDGAIPRRGGCCRYLAVAGDLCTNCPLRKAQTTRNVTQGAY